MTEGARIPVWIGEIKVASGPALFDFGSIGSCVGLIVMDPQGDVAGCASIMLPESRIGALSPDVGRYADTAVPTMLEALRSQGGDPARFVAAIAGGSEMLVPVGREDSLVNLGRRVSTAVERALELHSIPCRAKDVGGRSSRRVLLDTRTGKVTIESPAIGARVLCTLRGN